jgi:hypothetical protein
MWLIAAGHADCAAGIFYRRIQRLIVQRHMSVVVDPASVSSAGIMPGTGLQNSNQTGEEHGSA